MYHQVKCNKNNNNNSHSSSSTSPCINNLFKHVNINHLPSFTKQESLLCNLFAYIIIDTWFLTTLTLSDLAAASSACFFFYFIFIRVYILISRFATVGWSQKPFIHPYNVYFFNFHRFFLNYANFFIFICVFSFGLYLFTFCFI